MRNLKLFELLMKEAFNSDVTPSRTVARIHDVTDNAGAPSDGGGRNQPGDDGSALSRVRQEPPAAVGHAHLSGIILA